MLLVFNVSGEFGSIDMCHNGFGAVGGGGDGDSGGGAHQHETGV